MSPCALEPFAIVLLHLSADGFEQVGNEFEPSTARFAAEGTGLAARRRSVLAFGDHPLAHFVSYVAVGP